jgi:hypothetical protein
MTWQVFGTLAAGSQPLSLFDTLSGQIAQTVIVPCTATGTNAIALTATSAAPTISSYANYQHYVFVAANNSSGTVTVQFGALAALPLYLPGNIAAGSGNVTAGVLYEIVYNSALNAGGGGFVIISATPASLSLPVTVPNGGTGLTSLTPYALLAGGTASGANVQQVASLGTAGQFLQSQGAGALPAWAAVSAGAGSLVSIQAFTSSQTVTIPSTATKLFLILVGGGGGGAAGNGAGGPAGTAFSYLTGLTGGDTLALTVGGGATGNAAGGASTLSSGTQTISTITASGGGAGNGSGGTGGSTSGSNLFGINGSPSLGSPILGVCATYQLVVAGATFFAGGGAAIVSSGSINAGGAGMFPGNTATGNATGGAGGMLALWFS